MRRHWKILIRINTSFTQVCCSRFNTSPCGVSFDHQAVSLMRPFVVVYVIFRYAHNIDNFTVVWDHVKIVMCLVESWHYLWVRHQERLNFNYLSKKTLQIFNQSLQLTTFYPFESVRSAIWIQFNKGWYPLVFTKRTRINILTV